MVNVVYHRFNIQNGPSKSTRKPNMFALIKPTHKTAPIGRGVAACAMVIGGQCAWPLNSDQRNSSSAVSKTLPCGSFFETSFNPGGGAL